MEVDSPGDWSIEDICVNSYYPLRVQSLRFYVFEGQQFCLTNVFYIAQNLIHKDTLKCVFFLIANRFKPKIYREVYTLHTRTISDIRKKSFS